MSQQQQDPLDTLPSLTAGLSVFSQPTSEDNVVASFSLGSPEVGASNTYFGSPAGGAGAGLQTISLTDDDEEHTVFASNQPVERHSAAAAGAETMPAEAVAASETAELPASALHSTGGAAVSASQAEDAAGTGQHADATLPATVAGPLHAQDIPVKVSFQQSTDCFADTSTLAVMLVLALDSSRAAGNDQHSMPTLASALQLTPSNQRK
jgi:hypothetical protein